MCVLCVFVCVNIYVNEGEDIHKCVYICRAHREVRNEAALGGFVVVWDHGENCCATEGLALLSGSNDLLGAVAACSSNHLCACHISKAQMAATWKMDADGGKYSKKP